MKKLIIASIILLALGAAAFGQTLTDNSYYRKSVELRDLAKTAFDEGDYDAAADYAAQSQEYARLSDEYVAYMLSMDAANEAIKAAQERLDWAEGIQARRRFAEDFLQAEARLASAKAAYAEERYVDAKSDAEMVQFLLMGVTEGTDLPASYTVREFPVQTDCLWRIAALPFVYNDPLKWPELYRANKARLPDPSNPDLVRPGTVLVIPSLSGEYRWGAWEEGVQYPVYGAAQ